MPDLLATFFQQSELHIHLAFASEDLYGDGVTSAMLLHKVGKVPLVAHRVAIDGETIKSPP